MKLETMSYAAYSLYRDQEDVEKVVDALRLSGFRSTDISVLFAEHAATKDFAREKNTTDPEAGAKVGTGFAWLAGIGSLAVPGIGPFIAAESWGMLVGAGADAKPKTMGGAIAAMGIPEEEIKGYEKLVQEGRILLAVHCDTPEQRQRAMAVIEAS